MIWLATELRLWMVLAFAAGAVLTTVTSVRRQPTTRWVEKQAPAEPATSSQTSSEAAATAPTAASAPGSAPAPDGGQPSAAGFGSPFPEFRGDAASPAPWEAEEDWSRRGAPAS